ncbi:unnamed protein product [Aphis gossypii]|uniref:Uncharacterized protein n=1 Tax=Aphis gossypii TaxID=80765 RepID=A0A9P0ILZ5_APHGO|nr:unnamed protein product [Aphis gossypii]
MARIQKKNILLKLNILVLCSLPFISLYVHVVLFTTIYCTKFIMSRYSRSSNTSVAMPVNTVPSNSIFSIILLSYRRFCLKNFRSIFQIFKRSKTDAAASSAIDDVTILLTDSTVTYPTDAAKSLPTGDAFATSEISPTDSAGIFSIDAIASLPTDAAAPMSTDAAASLSLPVAASPLSSNLVPPFYFWRVCRSYCQSIFETSRTDAAASSAIDDVTILLTDSTVTHPTDAAASLPTGDAFATSVTLPTETAVTHPTDAAASLPTDVAVSISLSVAARPFGRVTLLYFRRVFCMYGRSIFDTVLNDLDATLQTLFCVD